MHAETDAAGSQTLPLRNPRRNITMRFAVEKLERCGYRMRRMVKSLMIYLAILIQYQRVIEADRILLQHSSRYV